MILKLFALILCLGLSVSTRTSAQDAPQLSGNAVELRSISGMELQFPYYPDVTSLDPLFREMTVKHVLQVLGYIKDVVGRSLMGERVNKFGWAGVTTKLIKMAHEARNARKNLKRAVGTGGKFNADMKEMFAEMLAESKQLEKTIVPMDAASLKVELEKVMDSLIEAIQASPVGSYFNWREGKINGKPFIQESSIYMAQLSKHGYRAFFSSINALLCLMVKFSNVG